MLEQRKRVKDWKSTLSETTFRNAWGAIEGEPGEVCERIHTSLLALWPWGEEAWERGSAALSLDDIFLFSSLSSLAHPLFTLQHPEPELKTDEPDQRAER